MASVLLFVLLSCILVVRGNTPHSDCLQEKETGHCKAHLIRFYYNKDTGECEEFTYGGCEGNANNFLCKEDCEAKCKGDKKCKKNEQYYPCKPTCNHTCENYGKRGPCPLYCASGCFCKEGLVLRKDGKCVQPDKCKKDKCEKHEENKDCGTACPPTCANKYPICRAQCRKGCFCKKGFIRETVGGKCIPESHCPPDKNCPKYKCRPECPLNNAKPCPKCECKELPPNGGDDHSDSDDRDDDNDDDDASNDDGDHKGDDDKSDDDDDDNGDGDHKVHYDQE